MKTLVLCTLNARYTHFSLALRLARNVLTGRRAPVMREYLITQNLHEIVLDLACLRPDVLLCSVYIWNARHFAALLPDLKRLLPELVVVAGGPEVAWRPQDWLARVPQTDLVVSGCAETALPLLEVVDWNTSLWPDKVLVAPADTFPESGQAYTNADFTDFATRYVYYESSRGCPFSCSYCLSSNAAHSLRFKPVQQVHSELELLLSHQPRLIKFVDRTFNADRERARAIWRFLMRQPGDCRFHFEIHPALLEVADLELLAACPKDRFQFELGIQTVHAETRRMIQRGGDWQAEKPLIMALRELGNIHLHVDLIVGLPGENLSMIAESFDQLSGLDADHLQLGFLKILSGTRMAEQASRHGMVWQQEAPYEVYRTATLDERELRFLKDIEELTESVMNQHLWDKELRPLYGAFGGAFGLYSALLRFLQDRGFDLRTRNRVKLDEQIRAWLLQAPEASPEA